MTDLLAKSMSEAAAPRRFHLTKRAALYDGVLMVESARLQTELALVRDRRRSQESASAHCSCASSSSSSA
jgi:hypothetical protein